MLNFTTESGAHYEVQDNGRYRVIRRIADESDTKKRADGEWLVLLSSVPREPVEGQQIALVVESLADRGPDDNGVQDSRAVYTTRLTTPVTKVWEA